MQQSSSWIHTEQTSCATAAASPGTHPCNPAEPPGELPEPLQMDPGLRPHHPSPWRTEPWVLGDVLDAENLPGIQFIQCGFF